jgi:hypothetical protein
VAPGSHELRVKIGGVTKTQGFVVNPKDYPEQHITLEDKSKVQLSAADEARADREIAVIKELKRHWRAAQDTDLKITWGRSELTRAPYFSQNQLGAVPISRDNHRKATHFKGGHTCLCSNTDPSAGGTGW